MRDNFSNNENIISNKSILEQFEENKKVLSEIPAIIIDNEEKDNNWVKALALPDKTEEQIVNEEIEKIEKIEEVKTEPEQPELKDDENDSKSEIYKINGMINQNKVDQDHLNNDKPENDDTDDINYYFK